MNIKNKLFTHCNEPSADVTSILCDDTYKTNQSKLGTIRRNWRTNFINVYYLLFSLFTRDLFM